MNNCVEKEKLIIWDFDGVLFDSLRECIVVLRISIELHKDKNLDIDYFDIDEICFVITATEHYNIIKNQLISITDKIHVYDPIGRIKC